MNRRAFSLIEAVMCVLLLAVAVPPVLELMGSAGEDRADTVNTNRATALASLVLETVVADVASSDPGLGPGVLSDPGAYLNSAETGLRSRLAAITEPYTRAGLSWELHIGPRVSSDGLVSSDQALNRFRLVTVRVTYASAGSRSPGAPQYVMPVSVMLPTGDPVDGEGP